jgi:hypothetical protein
MQTAPFFGWKVLAAIDNEIMSVSAEEQQHLALVAHLIEGNRVTAAFKTLNRYQIQPGKTFAASAKDKEKWKVLRLIANDVVLQNTKTSKIDVISIDQVMKRFNDQKMQEITFIDEIIETVKSVLGPALGVFLTGALAAWLMEKLSK